ncbi:hypothetical protein HMI54_011983 [Coelomomyces lativittatus]|nr:hypothetical protein HMI54_011983 [Coelomomyces lativittatus]
MCSACTTPAVIVKKGVTIQRLGIHFESSPQATPLIAEQFENELDAFIKRYNAKSNPKFELYRASPLDSSSLQIKLFVTQLVSPSQQTTGVVVSMLGLSLPVVMAASGAPIFLGFYYFPTVKSLTSLMLSPDIEGPKKSKNEFVLYSPGFLTSPEKQIEKHVVYFDRLLVTLVSQIERQTPKRKAKTLASGY